MSVERVAARPLAAVVRRISVGAAADAWRAALDHVWTFLRTSPGLRSDGHNVFLYRYPTRSDALMEASFGVEVTRAFEGSGEVVPTETPAGEAAVAVHVGPYRRMHETNAAILAWVAANGRTLAGWSWEIYSDPTEDEAALETTVYYLLR